MYVNAIDVASIVAGSQLCRRRSQRWSRRKQRQSVRMALFTHVWLRPRRRHRRPPTTLHYPHPALASSFPSSTTFRLMLKASVASPKLILVPCSEARRTPTPPTRSDGDVAPSGLPKPHQALKLNETTIQMGTHDLHCCIRELKALTSGHAPHTTTRNGRSCRATEPSGVLRAQTLSEDAVRHASEANWRIR